MSAAPLPSSAGTAAAPRRSRPPLPPLAALQIKIVSQYGGGGDGPASRDRAPSANGMRRAREGRGRALPRRWGPGLRRHRPAEGVGRAERTRLGGTSGAAVPAPPPRHARGVTPAGGTASAHRWGLAAGKGEPRGKRNAALREPREGKKGTGKGWA